MRSAMGRTRSISVATAAPPSHVYGPLLVGMRKPVYLMIPSNEVTDIVNMAAMAARDAHEAALAGA